ncbi:8546_t:CDS:1, partial [Racocetra fulgida]
NEKIRTRKPVKRMTEEVRQLLKMMFHMGTANPRQKMNAQQMHEKLLQQVQHGELREEDVPKASTIQNWIPGFSRRWKEAMALRSMDEN